MESSYKKMCENYRALFLEKLWFRVMIYEIKFVRVLYVAVHELFSAAAVALNFLIYDSIVDRFSRNECFRLSIQFSIFHFAYIEFIL